MLYLVIALVCGISFAPFVLLKLDVWHAQGLFAQSMIMLMFSASFFIRRREVNVKNVPLGLLHLWIGAYTAVIVYVFQSAVTYSAKNLFFYFFPYFNFLCVVVFYNIIVTHLYRSDIEKILSAMRWAAIVTLLTCVLQIFDLSQFFKLLHNWPPEQDKYFNNTVVGFIGNPTHLSGFLASMAPLFLWKSKREDWLCLILMFLVLFHTGTTAGDPSISGFVIMAAVLLYMTKSNKQVFIGICCLLVGAGLLALNFMPAKFFQPTGRIAIWQHYWDILHGGRAVTGEGLGTMQLLRASSPVPNAMHMHMEYFHYFFEIGIVGVLLILYMIKEFFTIHAVDKTERVLKTMVLAFLVSGCFNFPSHLWMPSIWAMASYGFLFCIKNEQALSPIGENYGFLKKRN